MRRKQNFVLTYLQFVVWSIDEMAVGLVGGLEIMVP